MQDDHTKFACNKFHRKNKFKSVDFRFFRDYHVSVSIENYCYVTTDHLLNNKHNYYILYNTLCAVKTMSPYAL